MASQQKISIASSSDHPSNNDDKINHILQINDDCLSEIFEYFSLLDLCSLNDTCKHFRNIAHIVFERKTKKSFYIPMRGYKVNEHHSVLRCFGFLIKEVFVRNFFQFDPEIETMNSNSVIKTFNSLERYCAGTIQAVNLLDVEDTELPPSAARLMENVKKITLYTSLSRKHLRTLLVGCKELVELDLGFHSDARPCCELNFHHLRKLSIPLRILDRIQFWWLEKFFKTHSKLVDLTLLLHCDPAITYIDISFISHLVELEMLHLMLNGERVFNVEAFANLKKLKKLTFDHTKELKTDIAILENIPRHNLEELTLGLSEVHDLVTSIERFETLTHLTISHDVLPMFYEFNTNISGLSNLRNSRLRELKVACKELLEPETIVDVIRNLSELKVIILSCHVDLSESICKQLVAVCSREKRSIEIRLSEELMVGLDIDYFTEFNKENGEFVRVTIK